MSFVHRDEDPRDYKVSFEKVRRELGFEPRNRVPDGVRELVAALERGDFGDAFAADYSNLESARRGLGPDGRSIGRTSS